MNLLEPALFPRASAYLAELPLGLQSHPQCTSRTDVARIILDEFPNVLSQGVSASLKRTLVDTSRQQERFPDVYGVLFRLMQRDRAFSDDEAYLKWVLEMSARVFTTPMYRVLMHVLSPSLVLAGAQRRWNAFREGTHLSSEGDKNGARLKLVYPARLYPRFSARTYAESFRAALQAAKAKDVQIEMTSHTETEAQYSLRWK